MNILTKFKQLFKPINLTEGTIWKVLITFTIPILLSYIFQQIYSITDAIIVGQTLSSNAVSGIGDANAVIFMVTELAIGIAGGFSVIIAKKIGEKNSADARKSLLIQIILSIIICAIITPIFIILIDPLLSWVGIFKSADANMNEVYENAYWYTFVIILGTIAVLLYNVIFGALRAIGDSFIPFLFLLFSTILNILLDLLFILVFKWGVIGTALATILSQFISAILCYWYTMVRYPQFRFKKEDFHISFKFVIEHLKQGLPLGFQFSILGIGIIIMQAGVVSFDKLPLSNEFIFGTPAQVGINAAYKLGNLLMTPFNALGTALLAFMGQNLGAKKYDRIKSGLNQATIIGFISWGIVAILGFLLTINGGFLYMFLSKDKVTSDVIRYGNSYMYLMLPFYSTLMLLFIYRNACQGIEKPLFPFLAGIGELVGRIVICLYLPALLNGGPINSNASPLAFYGLCFADAAAWILAILLLLYPVIHNIYKMNYKEK